jgi:hypothetical protein
MVWIGQSEFCTACMAGSGLVKVIFVLTGMVWIGQSQFCTAWRGLDGKSHLYTDWHGLDWPKSILYCLAWSGLANVNFVLSGSHRVTEDIDSRLMILGVVVCTGSPSIVVIVVVVVVMWPEILLNQFNYEYSDRSFDELEKGQKESREREDVKSQLRRKHDDTGRKWVAMQREEGIYNVWDAIPNVRIEQKTLLTNILEFRTF